MISGYRAIECTYSVHAGSSTLQCTLQCIVYSPVFWKYVLNHNLE